MKNKLCLVFLFLSLTSCDFSDESIKKNQEQIELWKQKPASRIEPLPEFSMDKAGSEPIRFNQAHFINFQSQSPEFNTCTPITEGSHTFALPNTSIDNIVFLRTKVIDDKGGVTVWANEKIVQIDEGNIISQQHWLITTVASDHIVLSQIDLKCGYTKKTQKLLIESIN